VAATACECEGRKADDAPSGCRFTHRNWIKHFAC
jgi:hypothetical protein